MSVGALACDVAATSERRSAVPSTGGNVSAGGIASGGAPTSAGAAATQGEIPAAAGGVGNGGTPTTAGSGPSEPFTLSWQDDFDTLDASRWALQTFSFDGNLAQFSTKNASVTNGILSIALTPEPTDDAKPYRGVELRSIPTITYGKVEARIRFAKGAGVVSSLVLIYTPWPADDWNEIDIEHLGKQADNVQLNCLVYKGAPTTPPVTTSVSPTQDPQMAPLGFDAEADFHVYAMEWTPSSVRFTADGALLRSWSSEVSRMKLPQNILLTIWASNAPSWAGAVGSDSAPTTADVDWIKVYSFYQGG